MKIEIQLSGFGVRLSGGVESSDCWSELEWLKLFAFRTQTQTEATLSLLSERKTKPKPAAVSFKNCYYVLFPRISRLVLIQNVRKSGNCQTSKALLPHIERDLHDFLIRLQTKYKRKGKAKKYRLSCSFLVSIRIILIASLPYPLFTVG